jgi:hypothetical protein
MRKDLVLIAKDKLPKNELIRWRRRYTRISIPIIHEIALLIDMANEEMAAVKALQITYANIPFPGWLIDGEKIKFEISHEGKMHKFLDTTTYKLTVETWM